MPRLHLCQELYHQQASHKPLFPNITDFYIFLIASFPPIIILLNYK